MNLFRSLRVDEREIYIWFVVTACALTGLACKSHSLICTSILYRRLNTYTYWKSQSRKWKITKGVEAEERSTHETWRAQTHTRRNPDRVKAPVRGGHRKIIAAKHQLPSNSTVHKFRMRTPCVILRRLKPCFFFALRPPESKWNTTTTIP